MLWLIRACTLPNFTTTLTATERRAPGGPKKRPLILTAYWMVAISGSFIGGSAQAKGFRKRLPDWNGPRIALLGPFLWGLVFHN
jgi:hypothetical protein